MKSGEAKSCSEIVSGSILLLLILNGFGIFAIPGMASISPEKVLAPTTKNMLTVSGIANAVNVVASAASVTLTGGSYDITASGGIKYSSSSKTYSTVLIFDPYTSDRMYLGGVGLTVSSHNHGSTNPIYAFVVDDTPSDNTGSITLKFHPTGGGGDTFLTVNGNSNCMGTNGMARVTVNLGDYNITGSGAIKYSTGSKDYTKVYLYDPYANEEMYLINISYQIPVYSHSLTGLLYGFVVDDITSDNSGEITIDLDPISSVAEWHFDEYSGTVAHDSSGNNNNGTIKGTCWGSGISGSALCFDGVKDYVEVPHSASLTFANSISIVAWLRMNPGYGGGHIISKDATSGATQIHISIAQSGGNYNAAFGIHANQDIILQGKKPLYPNTWYHITGVYDGTNMNLYVNGTLDTKMIQTGNIIPNSDPIAIGKKAHWPDLKFNGSIDEVSIYNRSLSAYDVISHYRQYLNSWREMNQSSHPSARMYSSMAYDSLVDRIILFGGYDGSALGDTWSYDLNTNSWEDLKSSVEPSPRYWHAMSYDSESDRVILFGGTPDGNLRLNDTWAYDYLSNTWINITPAIAPSPRNSHAMAYDSQNDKIILFGGGIGTGIGNNETWTYDYNANKWTKMTPSKSPSARWYHDMSYDSRDDRIILFGGDTTGNLLSDETWVYDYNKNQWTNMTTSVRPSPRRGTAMSYDFWNGQTILFGGANNTSQFNDTWRYDLRNNKWLNMKPSSIPPISWKHTMVYDFQSSQIVVFGGWNSPSAYLDDTWIYDYSTNSWMSMNPTGPPSARQGAAIAYDSWNDRVILFGGWPPGGGNGETWTYDYQTNSWTQKNPIASPDGRYNHAMAYDSKHRRVMLFGGFDTPSPGLYGDDTWAYDYVNNTWSQRFPLNKPSARCSHSIVYNSNSDRLILFGGWTGSTRLNDTWAYDFSKNNWTKMNPITSPSGRHEYSMSYDSKIDRVILFGGDTGIFGNDTWAYDYKNDSWKPLLPLKSPSVGIGHEMVYDSQSDVIVLFGGTRGTAALSVLS